MTDYFDVPLDIRISSLTRMVELREELTDEQVKELLSKLRDMTWGEWNAWSVDNLDKIADYADEAPNYRKKSRVKLGGDALLVHHGAMFLVGLLYLAKEDSFPHEVVNRHEQFGYDVSAMAGAIRLWERLEAHCDNWLYWQFDDPCPKTANPFKDES